MKRFGVFFLLALLTLFAVPKHSHAQGLYFETVRSGNDAPSTKVSYMPGMAKIVARSGHVILLRMDKQLVDILSPGKKMYSEISFDDLAKKRFATLTPEQRIAIEQHMAREKRADSSKANYDVDKTGDSKTIDGFKCMKYVLKKDGQPVQTIWATNDLKVASDFHKDAEKLLDRLESAMGTKDRIAQWVNKIDGFPIQMEGHGGTTTFTHIKQKSIPESQFEVPTGYTKASEAK